ncbi:MAG: hypothetical protein V3T82_08240, partial [Nitrospinaceae bacterium]
ESIFKVKEEGVSRVFRHIGLYAYTRSFLLEFTRMNPSPIEQLEKLEQLRILEHGYSIQVEITEKISMGIDRVEDLEKIERFLEK